MQLGLIHHVGYIVADLDDEIPVYRDVLGMDVGVREVMPEQGVEAVLLGSVAMRVAARCKLPLLIVRPRARRPPAERKDGGAAAAPRRRTRTWGDSHRTGIEP